MLSYACCSVSPFYSKVKYYTILYLHYIYIHSLLIQSLPRTREWGHRLKVYILLYQGIKGQKQALFSYAQSVSIFILIK